MNLGSPTSSDSGVESNSCTIEDTSAGVAIDTVAATTTTTTPAPAAAAVVASTTAATTDVAAIAATKVADDGDAIDVAIEIVNRRVQPPPTSACSSLADHAHNSHHHHQHQQPRSASSYDPLSDCELMCHDIDSDIFVESEDDEEDIDVDVDDTDADDCDGECARCDKCFDVVPLGQMRPHRDDDAANVCTSLRQPDEDAVNSSISNWLAASNPGAIYGY